MKMTTRVASARPGDESGPLDSAYGQLVRSLSDTRVILDVHSRERLMKLVTELQSQMDRKPG